MFLKSSLRKSYRFGEFASDTCSQQVQPLIQKTFQSSNIPDAKFEFTKTDFGDIPPKVRIIYF